MSFSTDVEIIFPGLVHFQYNTQYEVASTFLRLQEFYESAYDDIKGKVFDLETYMDAYAEDKGNFTYTADWSGFNVPGEVADNFNDLYSEKMLTKEYDLFDLITEHTHQFEKYYIIASSKYGGMYNDPREVQNHELAHGMCYLVPEYQQEQQAVVDIIKEEHPIFAKKLVEMGYCDDVIDDELHSYFATSTMTYLADEGFKDCVIPWQLVLKAQRIFENHYERLTSEEEE